MKTDIVELRLAPEDNRRLANVCGPMDENLRQIEAAFDVTIVRCGASFRVSGARLRSPSMSRTRCPVNA